MKWKRQSHWDPCSISFFFPALLYAFTFSFLTPFLRHAIANLISKERKRRNKKKKKCSALSLSARLKCMCFMMLVLVPNAFFISFNAPVLLLVLLLRWCRF
ncbi:MAG: hypothetical protein J3R72DRAFT_429601 [Linnemannia gamsii]|nr:MAG: hypothetical protein J3R72DRAFT_429601 [Linnemannia gamsii]